MKSNINKYKGTYKGIVILDFLKPEFGALEVTVSDSFIETRVENFPGRPLSWDNWTVNTKKDEGIFGAIVDNTPISELVPMSKSEIDEDYRIKDDSEKFNIDIGKFSTFRHITDVFEKDCDYKYDRREKYFFVENPRTGELALSVYGVHLPAITNVGLMGYLIKSNENNKEKAKVQRRCIVYRASSCACRKCLSCKPFRRSCHFYNRWCW